jgi:hypothetical protein
MTTTGDALTEEDSSGLHIDNRPKSNQKVRAMIATLGIDYQEVTDVRLGPGSLTPAWIGGRGWPTFLISYLAAADDAILVSYKVLPARRLRVKCSHGRCHADSRGH